MILSVFVYIFILYFALVPRYLESQNFRQLITKRIYQVWSGQIQFSGIKVDTWPRPVLYLENITISREQQFRFSCHKIILQPDLTKILARQPHIRHIHLEAPNLTVSAREDRCFSLSDLWQVASGLLTPNSLLSSLSLRQGSFSLYIHKKKISVRELQANLKSGPDLSLKGSCSSSLWQNLGFNLTRAVKNQTFQGDLSLSKLNVDRIKAFFPNVVGKAFQASLADLEIGLQGRVNDFQAKFKGFVPKLQVLGKDLPISAQGINFQGILSYSPEKINLDIKRLKTKRPQFTLSGSWAWRLPSNAQNIEIRAKGLGIEYLRDKSRRLRDRSPILDTVFKVLRSGNLANCHFKTSGSSKRELEQSLHIYGDLNKASIFIPKVDLLFHQVSGQFKFDNSVLKAQNIQGQTDQIQLSAGRIELGINPRVSSFNFQTDFKSTLGPIPKILNRTVPKNRVVGKINGLKALSGNLSGSFALSRRKDKWNYSLKSKDLQAKIQDPSLSQPVNILQGQIAFTPGRFSFESLKLASGDSYIDKISGYLDWQKKLRMSLKAGKSRIQLSKIPARLWQVLKDKAIPSSYLSYLPDKGSIGLTKTTWQGLVQDPGTWDISLIGSVETLELRPALAKDTVQIISGQFFASQDSLSFNDWIMKWDKSRVKLKGGIYISENSISKAAVNVCGHLGTQAVGTIFEKTELLPFPLKPQGPVHLSRAHFQWRDRNLSCQCQAVVAESTNIWINMEKDPRGWSLRSCSVKDNFSKAIFSLKTTKNGYKGNFDGLLTHQTLDRIIRDNRYLSGQFQGNLDFSFSYPDLSLTSANGTIQCNQLVLPGVDQLAGIHIRSLSLKAKTPYIQIKSAQIMWSENPLSVNGTVRFASEPKELRLYLSADTINQADLKPLIDALRKNDQDPDLRNIFLDRFQGTVRINIRSFRYRSMALKPLEARLVFQKKRPFQLDILDSSRLCTIPLSGRLNQSPKGWETSIDLSTQGNDLKETLSCLQKKDNPFMIGSFDFSGRLSGRGADIKEMLKDLNGPLQFKAYNGRIFHFDLLAKILSLLNTTEIFFGQLPEMDQDGLGYKNISVKGQVSNGTIRLKEGVVNGDSMGLGFQGDINFLDQELDLIVLVAPLKTLDRFFEKIPILGKIMGGHLISVPVRIKGEISTPQVIPLSPKAVSSGVYNIMKRSLQIPIRIFQPLIPQSPD